MFRKAKSEDIGRIMEIIEGTVELMNKGNNFQWSEDYPSKEVFREDISKGELFVYEDEGLVFGVVCLNREVFEGYDEVEWEDREDYLIIHRLAVCTKSRGKGIGMLLMNESFEYCKEVKVGYMKADTSEGNVQMRSLLEKTGFRELRTCKVEGFEEGFVFYDKVM